LTTALEANQRAAKYLVAAKDSEIANPIILNTDKPVIVFGGFEGRDRVFSIESLAGLVNEGSVRFFMIEERDIEQAELDIARRRLELGERVPRLEQLPRLKAHLEALADIHEKKEVRWITDNCEQVPQELRQSSTSTVLLFDCGTGAWQPS
jgi:4-amino-4-deoxy-L-arabinose transferase-like glycosyltransferase